MRLPSPFRQPRSAQRGYVMAMLLAGCVIIGILLTKAMPVEHKMVQRELEEELIFRGESIANAIKIYRAKTGGFPIELAQLMKVKPAILRKLYKDPITNDDFEIVTAVAPGSGGNKTGLPISGVRSKSQADSVKLYKEKSIHSDWIFSATDELYGGGAAGGGMNPGGMQPAPGKDGKGGSSAPTEPKK